MTALLFEVSGGVLHMWACGAQGADLSIMKKGALAFLIVFTQSVM